MRIVGCCWVLLLLAGETIWAQQELVTLTMTERANVARHGEWVTIGVAPPPIVVTWQELTPCPVPVFSSHPHAASRFNDTVYLIARPAEQAILCCETALSRRNRVCLRFPQREP